MELLACTAAATGHGWRVEIKQSAGLGKSRVSVGEAAAFTTTVCCYAMLYRRLAKGPAASVVSHFLLHSWSRMEPARRPPPPGGGSSRQAAGLSSRSWAAYRIARPSAAPINRKGSTMCLMPFNRYHFPSSSSCSSTILSSSCLSLVTSSTSLGADEPPPLLPPPFA